MQRTVSHSLKTSPQHHSHSQPMHSGSDASQNRTISIPGPLQSYTPESQQFLTSIPVQPVLATVFPTSTTAILSPLPVSHTHVFSLCMLETPSKPNAFIFA